jgi:hypothetical protein
MDAAAGALGSSGLCFSPAGSGSSAAHCMQNGVLGSLLHLQLGHLILLDTFIACESN